MGKRRSSTGRDYRTKEFKDSPFAPKNGGGSPIGCAAIIPGLIFVGASLTQSPILKSMEGMVALAAIMFVTFVLCLILVMRWERRAIERRQAKANPPTSALQDDTFIFDDFAASPVSVPLSMPKAFEHEIAQLIQASTGKRTRVCGGAGDGGVDVEVMDTTGRVIGIVQCKAFLKGKALPPSYVRELYAVKIQRGVGSAYLVTTAHVTGGTRQEAEKLGIRIIDSAALARLREKQHVQNKVFAQPVSVANERVVTIQTGVRDLWQDDR